MLIGLMSDTHGHVEKTIAAAKRLLQQDVEHVFHCGDISSVEVLEALSDHLGGAGIPVDAVLGNCEPDHGVMMNWQDPFGKVRVQGSSYDTVLAGKKIAVRHGHLWQEMDAMIENGNADYLFTGHTHVKDDHREGNLRIINPGAVYRSPNPTVAVVDLGTGRVKWISL